MTQYNIFNLYLALSISNGAILFAVTLLFSASALFALFIGGIAAITSLALLCLMCLPGAIQELPVDTQQTV